LYTLLSGARNGILGLIPITVPLPSGLRGVLPAPAFGPPRLGYIVINIIIITV